MVSISWIIFGIFTLAFVIGMIIHLSKEGYHGMWTGGGKNRWELGSWGVLQIIGYIIFLAIYGGIYWW